jgi:ABC-type Zn uptake system ZnuABC Zn-binding protein ZnuA
MFRSLPYFRLAGICLAVSAGLCPIAFTGCGSKPATVWPADRTGPKVVVSFAPYYCFAENVIGRDGIVQTMMTTSGPHDFAASDKDARLIQGADLFLVNGLGLDEETAEKLKNGSNNPNLKIVELGERIPKDKLLEGNCHHDHHGGDGDHEHLNDPHVWLSPERAQLLVGYIRDELKAADPAHAEGYDRRAAEYIAKLQKLQADGIELLKGKKDRKLVSFHDSMAYFAKSFDLNIVGVVEKTPGTEPNEKQLRELIALCADKEHPVRLIAVEPQYVYSNAGGELVKMLAQKGVPDPALVDFDTLETALQGQLNADWYETKMRANLANLAEKMK